MKTPDPLNDVLRRGDPARSHPEEVRPVQERRDELLARIAADEMPLVVPGYRRSGTRWRVPANVAFAAVAVGIGFVVWRSVAIAPVPKVPGTVAKTATPSPHPSAPAPVIVRPKGDLFVRSSIPPLSTPASPRKRRRTAVAAVAAAVAAVAAEQAPAAAPRVSHHRMIGRDSGVSVAPTAPAPPIAAATPPASNAPEPTRILIEQDDTTTAPPPAVASVRIEMTANRESVTVSRTASKPASEL